MAALDVYMNGYRVGLFSKSPAGAHGGRADTHLQSGCCRLWQCGPRACSDRE